jgi:acyl-CoA thioesterase-1
MDPIKVTFFGDSICVGQGISIYRGWVTRLAQRLAEAESRLGAEVLVTNASVNGRTSRQALEDMPYGVQSHGVDVLIVQFGMNDCNRWATDRGLSRVSLGAFVANIREIVERGFRFGASRIILNSNHPTSRTTDPMPGGDATYEDENRRYSEALHELAGSLDPRVSFQHIHREFSARWSEHGRTVADFLLPDGLHLNADGHDSYLARMHPVVESAVSSIAAMRSR